MGSQPLPSDIIKATSSPFCLNCPYPYAHKMCLAWSVRGERYPCCEVVRGRLREPAWIPKRCVNSVNIAAQSLKSHTIYVDFASLASEKTEQVVCRGLLVGYAPMVSQRWSNAAIFLPHLVSSITCTVSLLALCHGRV